jgi:hypothetical protein
MTADRMMAIAEVAQTLVDQFGIRAMLYVDDQVQAALDHSDGHEEPGHTGRKAQDARDANHRSSGQLAPCGD